MAPMRALVLCAAALAACSGLAAGQPLRIPANVEARDYGVNGTAAGRTALATLGTSNATLANLVDSSLEAHAAAEQAYTTAYAGQKSGTVASAAVGGAALLASAVALNNASSARAEAEAALRAADRLVAAIADENPLQTDNATFANLLLTYQIAHDGTLVSYWANMTAGEASDNATLADTVEFAPELAAAAAKQLARGASPALVSIAAEMVARNLLAAFNVYDGDFAAASQQELAEARLILKAVNVWQGNTACSGVNATSYLDQIKAAVQAAEKAAESISSADITAAKNAASAAVNSNQRCNAISPSLAPGSAPATPTATGRRML